MSFFLKHESTRRHGFSLIELLIVASVISILAAIAIPNFIQARMRALVTRTFADLKSCADGLEMYAADNRTFPLYGNPHDEVSAVSGAAITYLPVRLTTPISYLTQLPLDPFPPKWIDEISFSGPAKPYKYLHAHDQEYKGQFFTGSHVRNHFSNARGYEAAILYEVWSLGPDRVPGHDGLLYDLTNGLYSWGDIFRYGP